MALQQAFSLTPRESYLPGSGHYARMHAHGISNIYKYSPSYRYSFDHQHTSDELYFRYDTAGDAGANYAAYVDRRHVPHVILQYDLSDFQPHKEVALTFRFNAAGESRVLIYTDAGLIDDEILNPGDDQFLMEVESTSPLLLYFIHVNRAGTNYGGSWFFRGIDGYIA